MHLVQTETLTVWRCLPDGYVVRHCWLLPDPRRGLNTVFEHLSSSARLERSGNSLRTLHGARHLWDSKGRLEEDRDTHVISQMAQGRIATSRNKKPSTCSRQFTAKMVILTKTSLPKVRIPVWLSVFKANFFSKCERFDETPKRVYDLQLFLNKPVINEKNKTRTGKRKPNKNPHYYFT